ncbi:hypothetical protein KUTeg_018079 [Tegillarca granosa]|uniref:Uncharacterized protein n=1 Tax=Tegillarca granosa TaxID=220873 RepID=A0ABQ9EKU0_TEGGR|nr:hypothetical protein KUTeg_018079 [Tegillarca granosa]
MLCNAPIGIFQVSRQRFSQNATQQEKAELTLWLAIINMFMYFNYTFNFLFYCLSGTKFREDLKQMFSQCKKQKRF